ncbi:MAG: class I SAM-dependent methyltransferase [Pseudoalteromonas sp.]|uniref:class I SAM-dependent methyltransferase n=1 Tax=Pseudoalteromonas sp. TaxID=53249 RepID=UPI0025EFFAE4|nr:class I SAM-dependent methyltransferase [Pseudoalteromonas sp.]MCH2089540.1 class I SAM-dependent methyltransferase [Pseudoalteromonas sp.]
MSKQNWNAVYQRGEQLNLYPYDFIVSNFFNFRSLQGKKQISVLDLGCGGGNHSLFVAENGARVTAADYSMAALEVVMQRAKERGLADLISTVQVDFEDFVLPDQKFDLVIDRLSVTHTSGKYAQDVYKKLYGSLNDGGVILSCMFSMGHTHKDFGYYDESRDIWIGFSDGIFQDLLAANFYNKGDIKEIFSSYKLKSLKLETDKELLEDKGCMEVWKIVAQK